MKNSYAISTSQINRVTDRAIIRFGPVIQRLCILWACTIPMFLLCASPNLLGAVTRVDIIESGQSVTSEPINDKSGLPKVLLIGDSIAAGYTAPVRKLLEGKAVIHGGQHGGPSTLGLPKLNEWLGDGRWDVIHFNWGLNDLEARRVPIDLYERNLRALVKRLKKTGARLIWCSTTPVPTGKVNSPRNYKDVPAYNEVAKKIMDENGIEINDLYSFALQRLAEIQLKEDVHFSTGGYVILAEEVARHILRTP